MNSGPMRATQPGRSWPNRCAQLKSLREPKHDYSKHEKEHGRDETYLGLHRGYCTDKDFADQGHSYRRRASVLDR